jgi:benzil reductase ((S)-benzoin forming)
MREKWEESELQWYIITGASQGIGKAMMRRLMRPGCRLTGIARGDGSSLLAEAQARNVPLHWISSDLSDPSNIESVMAEAFSALEAKPEGVYLINNAGTVEPIAPAGECSVSDLARNVSLNLIAPMALTAEFIRRTNGWNADRRVLNISSGAGKKPYFGWSAYCASKAGLDMFTRCAGEELQHAGSEVRILSAAPGVVDTDMQRRIRETPPEQFRQRDRFVQLKESGMLLAPEEAADKLLKLLFDDRHPNGAVLDIRDL